MPSMKSMLGRVYLSNFIDDSLCALSTSSPTFHLLSHATNSPPPSHNDGHLVALILNAEHDSACVMAGIRGKAQRKSKFRNYGSLP